MKRNWQTLKDLWKDGLKDLWEKIACNPSNPVPPVRRKLEEKGYKFADMTQNCAPAGGEFLPAIVHIFNKKGYYVTYWDKDDLHSREYRADYDHALAEHKAARTNPAPG